jgi:hypothetical protein
LNMPARAITAHLIDAFLDVAGFTLFTNYRAHYVKLVVFIRDDYLQKCIDAGAEDGPVNRLRGMHFDRAHHRARWPHEEN